MNLACTRGKLWGQSEAQSEQTGHKEPAGTGPGVPRWNDKAGDVRIHTHAMWCGSEELVQLR